MNMKKSNSVPIPFAESVMEEVICEQRNNELPEHPPERVKNPHAVAMSKLGSSKGGKARAESLTAKQRSRIARKAARARWNKVA